LNAVGISLWLAQEDLFHAVTAVSGSGPAYFFYLMEAMTDAGVQLGLPRDVAERLTLHTALGAADMAVHSDVDPAELRRRVTSPNGTTEQAVKSFPNDDLPARVARAMEAAAERSADLSSELARGDMMDGMSRAAVYVVQTLGSLYLLIVLLRFILQLVRADFYNPLSQFIVRATQPL